MSKRKRGRPIGGESPEALREYWRKERRKYRAKKKLKEAAPKPDLSSQLKKLHTLIEMQKQEKEKQKK